MGRIIALALVAAGIWWMWRKLTGQQSIQPDSTENTSKSNGQRLSQCQRCDAMLPSDTNDRQEVARSCDHKERCPLQHEG